MGEGLLSSQTRNERKGADALRAGARSAVVGPCQSAAFDFGCVSCGAWCGRGRVWDVEATAPGVGLIVRPDPERSRADGPFGHTHSGRRRGGEVCTIAVARGSCSVVHRTTHVAPEARRCDKVVRSGSGTGELRTRTARPARTRLPHLTSRGPGLRRRAVWGELRRLRTDTVKLHTHRRCVALVPRGVDAHTLTLYSDALVHHGPCLHTPDCVQTPVPSGFTHAISRTRRRLVYRGVSNQTVHNRTLVGCRLAWPPQPL